MSENITLFNEFDPHALRIESGYFWNEVVDLFTLGSRTWRFSTGPNRVLIRSVNIKSNIGANRGLVHTTFDLFQGGDVTGGTPIEVFTTEVVQGAAPQVPPPDVFADPTINTPGNKILGFSMIGDRMSTYDESFGNFSIPPENDFYITITNVVPACEVFKFNVVGLVIRDIF